MTEQKQLTVRRVAKISMKTVVGDIKKLILSGQLADGETYPLMRVRGQVGKMTSGTGDYGTWVAFRGVVEATNLITGEIVASNKVFLPDVVSDEMAMALQNAEDGAFLQFSYDILVNVDHDLPTLYQYSVDSHFQNGGTDPLALIREKEPELPRLQLAAPAGDNKALADKVAAKEAEEKAEREATANKEEKAPAKKAPAKK